MWKLFCRFVLYRLLGWTAEANQPLPEKYIICLAPHTSNWDFVVGQLYAGAEGMKINFLMKKEWFRCLLRPLFIRLGGIPVERSHHTNLTDHLAYQAEKMEHFALCITPEGTRKANADWKLGFYYIAEKARLPILLYAADYSLRRIICTKTVIPTGDIEKQMKEIKNYYRGVKGKYPDNFKI